MNQTYHLAQINIARMLAPIDSEIMASFVAQLDEINELGDRSPGFVWRLQTEDGDATAIKVYDDPFIIVNMTVWESIDALFNFTYASDHVDVFRNRRDWFEKMDTPAFCLWWIPAGTIPTPEEASKRLELLTEQGATPLAFNFKKRFTVEEMLAYTQPKSE